MASFRSREAMFLTCQPAMCPDPGRALLLLRPKALSGREPDDRCRRVDVCCRPPGTAQAIAAMATTAGLGRSSGGAAVEAEPEGRGGAHFSPTTGVHSRT